MKKSDQKPTPAAPAPVAPSVATELSEEKRAQLTELLNDKKLLEAQLENLRANLHASQGAINYVAEKIEKLKASATPPPPPPAKTPAAEPPKS